MENTRYLEGSTEYCSGNRSSKQEKITLYAPPPPTHTPKKSKNNKKWEVRKINTAFSRDLPRDLIVVYPGRLKIIPLQMKSSSMEKS